MSFHFGNESQTVWYQIPPVGTTSFTIAGLEATHVVSIRAFATVYGGEVVKGPHATGARDPVDPPEVPGKPIVTLSAGNERITVSWTEPASGGAEITDYDVRYRQSGCSSWNDWVHQSLDRTVTITGLTSGTTYQVKVRANNSAGGGQWSDTVTVTLPTPAAAPTSQTGSSGSGQTTASLGNYFTDDDGNVHELNINIIAQAGITVGCHATQRLFCPDDQVTRAQMAVFLVRALGETPSARSGVTFTDVASDAWYAGFVGRLAELGLTSGFRDQTFRPDDQVTRAQMATFLVRAVERLRPGDPGATGFSDVSSDHTHAAAIAGLVRAGVTTGYSDGTYRPDEPITRAQMATFLVKAFGLTA